MTILDGRVSNLERDNAAMKVEIKYIGDAILSLRNSTDKNTDALKTMTDTLSYNRGIVAASARFASFATLVVGAAWGVGTWVSSLFHVGPK